MKPWVPSPALRRGGPGGQKFTSPLAIEWTWSQCGLHKVLENVAHTIQVYKPILLFCLIWGKHYVQKNVKPTLGAEETGDALCTSTMITLAPYLRRMELRRWHAWPGPRTMLNLLSAQWTEWYFCMMNMGSGETSSPPNQLTWRWRGLPRSTHTVPCTLNCYPRKLCHLPSSPGLGKWFTHFLSINLLGLSGHA